MSEKSDINSDCCPSPTHLAHPALSPRWPSAMAHMAPIPPSLKQSSAPACPLPSLALMLHIPH